METNKPDRVEQYALDVTTGREMAGPLVRAACARHLKDLADSRADRNKRGIWWDRESAENVFGFFHDVLRLSGSEHEGKPFELAPAQAFIVGSLFGWRLTADFSRRFRLAYIEIAKGNGKTPLAAGIGLYMLTADGCARAEVYAAAVDKDQARILFRDAVSMVDQSPALSRRLTKSGGKDGDVTKVWNLAHLESGSFFRPISSESSGRGKSGFRPYCVLLDEIHEHPTDAMVEFTRKNLKGRPNALALMTTNSGVTDTASVCYRYHDYAESIMEGRNDDDQFFGFVAGLDKGDSWTDPAIMKKANPLLNISVRESYIAQEVKESLGMPAKQSITRRLNFCEWVGSENPFIDPQVWRENGNAMDPALLRGRQCYGGLDLSSINDLAALVLAFPLDDGRIAILPYFWKAQDVLREHGDRDRAPYQQWAADGFLLTTPGPSIWFPFIARQLGELSQQFDIRGVGFDPWRIQDFKRECEGISAYIEFVKHGQGYSGGDVTMTYSIAALEEELLNRRLLHGGHPVLEWCVNNAKVTQDAAENRKFDKRKQTGRIDGVVACAMAVGLAKSEPVPGEPQFFVLGGSNAR